MSVGETTLKIAQHLAKLEPKIEWCLFSGHGVYSHTCPVKRPLTHECHQWSPAVAIDCQNDWIERDAVCGTDSCASKEPRISCGCTLALPGEYD